MAVVDFPGHLGHRYTALNDTRCEFVWQSFASIELTD